MKKIFLLLAFTLLFNSGAYALTATQTFLNKVEDSLYGYQYSDEKDLSRLERIENTVYGSTSKKSQNERIAKLRKDLAADLIGHEITPTEDTFADPEDSYKTAEVPKEASNITYPAVDELEQKIFKKTFPKEDISARLSKLEKQTFNKTYNDDLSTRVDRLKAEIKPESIMNNSIAQSSNTFFDEEDIMPLGSDYHMNRYSQPDRFNYDAFNARQNAMFQDDYDDYTPTPMSKKASLSTVEKKLLKQNFDKDTMENRLARVEQYMFGSVFESDDLQTRADRISSAYNAQKSAGKYDSNKFAQRVTTGAQIGMLILMVLACIL